MKYVLKLIVQSDNLKRLQDLSKDLVLLEQNYDDEYSEIEIIDTDTGKKVEE